MQNLTPFLVIDQLLVGPVHLEKNRLVMPYAVTINGQTSKTELIYKYEEAVFDPSSHGDQNLGSMIGAQVAFNYGLFCKKIVFDGLYDHTDRRFIQEMTENTSREILVKKILEPNVFLVEGTPIPEAKKLKSYTQAAIQFVNTSFQDQHTPWKYWHSDRNKHLVLSSGGKDSLLSYGLLKELGKEVHPVFGNESGRHWFTALNGYRFQKETDPNTSRVWMNSDRVFNWMLRHLSFIRKDFANIRADDYPIRLWTVAVFLFGVLPVMKKRKIGRLVIGDEYDSSVRGNFNGISHYNGLYDQSRWFDEALSRYYMKKGWAISQFSVIRPLSELLIMKILLERFPELQQHQTSCHATHQREGRILPCGKCEKCRRIIGMITALDGDPSRCGYTIPQIEDGLKTLATRKIKQIGTDSSHLYFMLHQKGKLEVAANMRKPYPHILKLRFDKERSQMDNIPQDLRIPLYQLLLQHADGAVKLENRKWMPFDPFSDPGIHGTYPFEMGDPVEEPGSKSQEEHLEEQPLPFEWGKLTWEEAEKQLKKIDIALLPVGAIEQHGPHLPMDVDAFDAAYLAQKVAEACSHPKPLVLPLVPYGVSYHHGDFPGTLSISNEAMAAFIYDIGMSVAQHGIKKLIIINGHGDNAPTLNFAAQMINRDAHIFVCVDTGETSDKDIYKLVKTHNDIHAGEVETSTTLAIRPELVRMDKAKNTTLKFSSRYLDFFSHHGVPWYVRTKKISESGTMGDPTQATAEKGKKIWEIMIAHLVAFVEELKGLSLEEIYQKRY